MSDVLANPWKPLPAYSIQQEKIRKPKINDDVEANSFKVILEATGNTVNKGVKVSYNVDLSEEDKINDIVVLNKTTTENTHKC